MVENPYISQRNYLPPWRRQVISDAFDVPFKCPAFTKMASTMTSRIHKGQIALAVRCLGEVERGFVGVCGPPGGADLLHVEDEEAGEAALDALYAGPRDDVEARGSDLLLSTPTLGVAPDDAATFTLAAEYARSFRTTHPLPRGSAFLLAGDVAAAGGGGSGGGGGGGGDGARTIAEWAAYHGAAAAALFAGGAEIFQAWALTTVAEAAGAALAAAAADLPAVVVFSLDGSGALPCGATLADAVAATDAAVAASGGTPPLFYGALCGSAAAAAAALADAGAAERVGRLDVLASDGDESALVALVASRPHLRVLGGAAAACRPPKARAPPKPFRPTGLKPPPPPSATPDAAQSPWVTEDIRRVVEALDADPRLAAAFAEHAPRAPTGPHPPRPFADPRAETSGPAFEEDDRREAPEPDEPGESQEPAGVDEAKVAAAFEEFTRAFGAGT